LGGLPTFAALSLLLILRLGWTLPAGPDRLLTALLLCALLGS
jgi:hypothetical protein